jgi:hypothetical protein
MRRFFGVFLALLVLATAAAPAGAQTAPEEATVGLCTAHFFGIMMAPQDVEGIHVAHAEVPLPTEACP